MNLLKKETGVTYDEIIEKITEKYGKDYKVINKGSKLKYKFPLIFKKEYFFEYETGITHNYKEIKTNDKERIISNIAMKINPEASANAIENKEVIVAPKTEVEEESTEYKLLKNYLIEQELSEKNTVELLSKASKKNPNDIREWKKYINEEIKETLSDWKENNDFQILTLFGPTGVGKTTTLIKIMNILQHSKTKIGVITTDNYRVGAYEQMSKYSKELDFPLIQSSVDELEHPVNVFKYQKGMDYILIDTYGRNSKDEQMKSELEVYLKTVNPENISLVLAANQKYKDMIKTIRSYEGVHIDHIIITKVDETDSFGFVYNLHKEFNIPISYLTYGQRVPDDITTFKVDKYTEKLWGSFSL